MTDTEFTRRRSGKIVLPLLLVVVIAAAWTGFWFYAASTARTIIAAWQAQEAALGRVYRCGSQSIGGYPFRIEVQCADADVELSNAQPALGIKVKNILVAAQVYSPTLLIGEITGPVTVGELNRPASLSANWTLAQLSIRGLPSALQRVSMTFDDLKLTSLINGVSPIFAAKHLELHGRPNADSSPGNPIVDLAVELIAATAPSAGPIFAVPADASIAATMRGIRDFITKPMSVRLREFQAAGGRIDVTSLRLTRGESVAVAAGRLGLTASGRLDGQVNMTVAGFDRFIASIGGIEKLAPSIKLPDGSNALNGLDRLSGSLNRLLPGLGAVVQGGAATGLLGLLGQPAQLEGRSAVALALQFDDGAATLGPIRLGQVPPLY